MGMPSAAYGLRHPASTSCLGRHLRLAGRCPNNSSLFPPLAAVVVVAGQFQRKNDFYLRDGKICGSSRLAFFTEGAQRGTGGFFIHILALSVTFGDSSPKGRALGGPHRLHLFANVSPFDRLPPAGESLSKGDGFWLCRKVALLGKGVPLGELLSAARLRGYTANHKPGRQKHLPGLLFAIFFTAPRR